MFFLYGQKDGEKIVDLSQTVFVLSTNITYTQKDGLTDEQMISKGDNTTHCISLKDDYLNINFCALWRLIYHNASYSITKNLKFLIAFLYFFL